MSEPNSNLYKILNILYDTDKELWKKLSGALGSINTLNNKSVSLSAITPADSAYASQYALVDQDNNQIGTQTINIPKDQFLSDAKFGYSSANSSAGTNWQEEKTSSIKYPTLKLTFELSGSKNPVYIPVNNLIDTYTAGSGLSLNNNEFSLNVEDADGFLTRTADGVKLSGVQSAIDSAISSYDTTLKGTASGITLFSDTTEVVNGLIDAKISSINTSLAEAVSITTNALTGYTDTATISGAASDRKVSFGIKKSADNGNAVELKSDGIFVQGIEAGDNISISTNSSTGKLKISNTYTFVPTLASGTTSGLVYSGADVSITDGQITVNNAASAKKVEKSIKVFDFDFNGSASGQISAGFGLSKSALDANNLQTISVDTETIATRDYVEQVSLLVASAVASSGDLEFWTGLSGLVELISGLNEEIKS